MADPDLVPTGYTDYPAVWQVTFFSHTGLDREKSIVPSDTYAAGYQFEAEAKVVALSEGGYVF